MQSIIDATMLLAGACHQVRRGAICAGGFVRLENEGRTGRLHGG